MKGANHRTFRRVANFQPERWGTTRRTIAALGKGETITVAAEERNNAVTSITRIQDAYEGTRKYRTRTTASGLEITRIL